jgi:hypothetical protein
MPEDAERELISMVYRCCGKHTYGVDYLAQVGPFPTNCPTCGGAWVGEPRYEDEDQPQG